MLFDQLWWAERRAATEKKRIHEHYEPLMEAAKKEKNEHDYQSALSAMLFEINSNDEPDVIRTEGLIKKARRLGIPLPPRPAFDSPNDDPHWIFNQATGNWVFTDAKELELGQQIRKLERDIFEHRWLRLEKSLPLLTLVVLIANAYIYYRQATIMKEQARQMAGQERIMEKTLPIVGEQAIAAKSAADAAYASIRPWIKIESVELVQANDEIKTLMFHFPLTGRTMPPMIQTKVSLVNVGHSVAQDAEVFCELFFAKFESETWYEVVTQEEQRYCQSVIDRTPSAAARIAFPSDSWESNNGIGGIIRETDIMRTAGSPVTHAAASLILCVNYRGFTSDRLQTQARFSVAEDRSLLIELGNDTDASRLHLVREPRGDHAN
jgi:hypothetical protein